MTTIRTKPSRGSVEADSIDSFFAIAEDEPLALSAKPKPESRRKESKPIRNTQPMSNVSYTEAYDEPIDWWGTTLRGVSILCFVTAIAMFARGYFSAPLSSTGNLQTPVLTSAAQPRALTTKIEDIRLGTRVLGENPIESQVEAVIPSPKTWNEIHLEMTKQSGAKLWVELLRPVEWLKQHEASTGGTVYLEMHEMGAVGDAVVTFIGPCPEIKSGKGTIVTGRFKHQADENSAVVRLKLQGQAEATGVTTNHPYWSIDRQAFVEVGGLMEGERVDTKDGESRVVSIARDQYTGFLYNLETLEHVYRVGTLGTVVHNECAFERFASKLEAEQSVAAKGLHIDPKFNGKFKNVVDAGKLDPKALGRKKRMQFSHRITIELRDGARTWLRKKGVEPPLGHGPETWQMPANLVDEFNELFVKSVTASAR